ncbi:hypothetical protein [Sedimentitalea todarodis]|uniref:Excalibur calcium-binding domain-containing protein n=1 Tax=Sedimentitalea todarodis TaxID=1631240 RepID=A0ABU3VJI4_9RHOB|nr:hypothetical protein [Sedimentitalea todarodis]MDU9006347.1 hypothetical protein [Sedimentitalea todarodis]
MHSVARIPLFLGLSLGLISACAPQVPDSGATYNAREAELASGVASAERLSPPQAVASQTLTPSGTAVPPAPGAGATAGTAEGIAAETAAVLASSSTAGRTSAVAPAAPAPVVASTGLSVENDFSAVSENRSIQSDAALIAQNNAQYQVIEPTELPSRSGGSQPNIVAYALSSSHPKGTRVYSRSGINLQGRADRNCANFPSADLAQIEFLSKGGPDRDRAGLDPDGDGYACGWDPAPFRKAQNG